MKKYLAYEKLMNFVDFSVINKLRILLKRGLIIDG